MAVTLQNGFFFFSNALVVANLYVLLYLILLLTVFGLFFNFQLKSSNIDFRTLRNTVNHHSNSQYRYYFLYLGLIFPVAELFYLIFNESKSVNSYFEFLIGAFCVFIFIITSKKEIAKYSYTIFRICFYLLLLSVINGFFKENMNFLLFSKYLLLLFFAFAIFLVVKESIKLLDKRPYRIKSSCPISGAKHENPLYDTAAFYSYWSLFCSIGTNWYSVW